MVCHDGFGKVTIWVEWREVRGLYGWVCRGQHRLVRLWRGFRGSAR